MLMVTLKPHDYADRQLHEGDEFDCAEEHVNLLTLLGRAALVSPPVLVHAASQRAIVRRKAP